DYPGTLLLVSHDRRFLDNVVTQTLVAEGDGQWREYVGGYSDWLQQAGTTDARVRRAPAPPREGARAPQRTRTQLSYKEERELGSLPDEIEALEREQAQLTARMSDPGYHRQGVEQIRDDRRRLDEIEAVLEAKFARWAALEELRDSLT